VVGREGELRPKMIRKMIKIRLGDNKEGLIFDTTPVIVHMVETTHSNSVSNSTKNNPETHSIMAELSRHTNTWENISNCVICNKLSIFNTENGLATNVYKTALGFYASDDRISYIRNDAKWSMSIITNSSTTGQATSMVVSTRKEFYDINGHIYQQQVDVPAIKKAFKNKTAI
jgi:GTPase involved in cell partitioning and DNA repair